MTRRAGRPKVRSVPPVGHPGACVRRARSLLRFVGNALNLENSPDENISRLTTDSSARVDRLTFRRAADSH